MRQFTAVVFRAPLGVFVAEFPGLPDCVAVSSTLEGVADAAADALCAFLEAAQQGGQPIPEPLPFDAIASDPRNADSVASFTVTWPGRRNWTAAGVFPADMSNPANDG